MSRFGRELDVFCRHMRRRTGFVEYAVTRGAELKIVMNGGAYVFCYRPAGEFSTHRGLNI